MQTVIETPTFLSNAKSAGLSDMERWGIVNAIAADPQCGETMVGTGGARKVRFAGRSKGKSGGYRVITYFGGEDIPVFLLALFGKGERANLSQGERNELVKILGGLADAYRAGVRSNVQER